MQDPIRLIGRWKRRFRIKCLVWRVRLLSHLDVKPSGGALGRKNLRMKVVRVTRDMLKSR
ncbi:hypothetical protein KY363_02185 [Candidatus Woesearchaeota archaeon]|nr:hypothetical protein [Candidatus Woesearchaeota archaeon]